VTNVLILVSGMNVKETMIANNKVTCAKMENVYLMNLLIWDMWCESDEDCGNDDLVCTDDNYCLGNECTETYDETTGYTSTGCTG